MSEPEAQHAAIFAAVHWNADGLVPAIAQDARSGQVLMLAWMNADALLATLRDGMGTYWSRSRQALWRKGETSGHIQHLVDLRLDCDGDTVLLRVIQEGPACHTGSKPASSSANPASGAGSIRPRPPAVSLIVYRPRCTVGGRLIPANPTWHNCSMGARTEY
jgi:phosphoribosyl-ATP pyrophosphohydrolase/phosphoribosyl-AMP cyclohydrolase